MRYTQVKFRGSCYLPGFGQSDQLNDVDTAPDVEGANPFVLRVKGPAGIVTIPWSAVLFAFEAETVTKLVIPPPPAPAVPYTRPGQGWSPVSTTPTVRDAEMERAFPVSPEVKEALIAGAVQAATVTPGPIVLTSLPTTHGVPVSQPPPPQKKGGRR